MNQMDESRQNPISGQSTNQPAATGTGDSVAPSSRNLSPTDNGALQNGPQDGTAGNPSGGATTGGASTSQ
jgi:hypothetical protein